MEFRLRSMVLGIISELALWGGILLVLAALLSISARLPWGNFFKPATGQTVTLQFNDVSQLAIGSLVNFMGTDIGYVTRVRPKNGQVEVRFKTYSNSIIIPKGAHYTVEFNGLAGAKTLEILPPSTNKASVDVIEEPIRLRTVIDTQMILAKALEHSAENIAEGLGEVSDENSLTRKVHFFDQRVVEAYRTLVFGRELVSDKARNIHIAVSDAKSSISSITQALHAIQRVTDPTFFRTNTMATIRYISLATEDIYQTLTDTRNTSYVDKLAHRLEKTNTRVVRAQTNLGHSVPQFVNLMGQINQTLLKADGTLSNIEKAVIPSVFQEHINALRQRLKSWAELSAKLNKGHSDLRQ